MEHRSTLPDGLLGKLELASKNLRFTSAKSLYHCVWLWGETYCGVFGDGQNGAYEWFIFGEKGMRENVETSDKGYGSTSVALRDVLLKMEPLETADPVAVDTLRKIGKLSEEWRANNMGGADIQRKRWQRLGEIAIAALKEI